MNVYEVRVGSSVHLADDTLIVLGTSVAVAAQKARKYAKARREWHEKKTVLSVKSLGEVDVR